MSKIKRKRHFSYYEKQAILSEHFTEGLSIGVLSRKYQIHPVTLYSWKRMIDMSKSEIPNPINIEEILKENLKLQKEVKTLKHAVGELTLDKLCMQDIIDLFKKLQREDEIKKLQKVSKQKNTNVPASQKSLDAQEGHSINKNEKSLRDKGDNV